jgi:hypothetical protein
LSFAKQRTAERERLNVINSQISADVSRMVKARTPITMPATMVSQNSRP